MPARLARHLEISLLPVKVVSDREFFLSHCHVGFLGVLGCELAFMSEKVIVLRGQVDHIDRRELLFDQVLPAEHHHLAWLLLRSERWLLLLLVNYTLVLAAENRGIIVGVR